MARVRLTLKEIEEGKLPPFCIRCGAPAAGMRSKRFAWHPSWIGWYIILGLLCMGLPLIVALILRAFQTKRMRIKVPLCEQHWNHWQSRQYLIYGGFAILISLGFLPFCIPADQVEVGLSTLKGLLCLGTLFLGLIWLIVAAMVENEAIHPEEITKKSITLIKVSPKFVDALRAKAGTRWEEAYEDQARQRATGGEGIHGPEAPRLPDVLPDGIRPEVD
jgi:hypothetical protein